MPPAKKCQKLFTANSGGTKNTKRRNGLSFNLVTHGGRGGGGFLARTIRLLAITQKRLNLAPPNLVTFSFYLLGTFWEHFSKSIHQEVAAVIFEI